MPTSPRAGARRAGGPWAARWQAISPRTRSASTALDAYVPTGGRKTRWRAMGRPVASDLAKNPVGFDRQIQQIKASNGRLVAFFLNDAEAEGRDVSWIWDVDFECLAETPGIRAFVGGSRANDLQVRLKYAGIDAQNVERVEQALQIKASNGRLVAFFLNDAEAEGRDVSWIWDVDFECLAETPGIRAFVGGSRANDLQVRLKYAGIDAQNVERVEQALASVTDEPAGDVLFAVANYTAFPPGVFSSLSPTTRRSRLL